MGRFVLFLILGLLMGALLEHALGHVAFGLLLGPLNLLAAALSWFARPRLPALAALNLFAAGVCLVMVLW